MISKRIILLLCIFLVLIPVLGVNATDNHHNLHDIQQILDETDERLCALYGDVEFSTLFSLGGNRRTDVFAACGSGGVDWLEVVRKNGGRGETG